MEVTATGEEKEAAQQCKKLIEAGIIFRDQYEAIFPASIDGRPAEVY